jgi:hypothetical protein
MMVIPDRTLVNAWNRWRLLHNEAKTRRAAKHARLT